MEDFQQLQWPFDFEKSPNSFLLSSLTVPGALSMPKDKQFDALESPIISSDRIMRPDLHVYEPNNLLVLNKEEDFSIDATDGLKVEHVETNNQYYQQQGNQPQLDITLEPNLLSKPQDYGMDPYRIRRSRGPSFNIGSQGRRGSEDFFNTNLDFMRYFRNGEEQETDAPQEGVKHEYEETYPEHVENVPVMYDFSNLPAKELNINVKDDQTFGTSDGAAADESTLQLSVPGTEYSVDNHFNDIEVEQMSSTKKKRKTNTNTAIIEEPNKTSPLKKTPTKKPPKLKKSKSENKTAKYSLTPKGNSFSIKLTKLSDGEGAEVALSTPKIKKQASKNITKDPVLENIKTEETSSPKEKSPEESQSTPNSVKVESGTTLQRSKSNILETFFQGKNLSSLSDLVAGLGLPVEVEEMLNSSKLFSNLQLSSTRKIGTLTVEERRIKVEKYFEKRKKRTWSKKINYDCRKRVADSRLRFKGRFVTKSQAFAMLEEEGIFPDQNKITETEIKNLLEERFGSDTVKKKEKEGDGRKNNGRPKKQAKTEEDGIKVKDEEEWLGKDVFDNEDSNDMKSITDSSNEDF